MADCIDFFARTVVDFENRSHVVVPEKSVAKTVSSGRLETARYRLLGGAMDRHPLQRWTGNEPLNLGGGERIAKLEGVRSSSTLRSWDRRDPPDQPL